MASRHTITISMQKTALHFLCLPEKSFVGRAISNLTIAVMIGGEGQSGSMDWRDERLNEMFLT